MIAVIPVIVIYIVYPARAFFSFPPATSFGRDDFCQSSVDLSFAA